MAMELLSISITQPQMEALHDLSKETGMELDELIRRAIDRYMNDPEVTKDKRLYINGKRFFGLGHKE
jgi:hypothetical protein